METRADRKRGISGIFDEDAADRDRFDLRVYPCRARPSDPDFARCYRISLGVSSLWWNAKHNPPGERTMKISRLAPEIQF
jgi:hypothetical protein